MQEALEMLMLICFGISWPVSVLKSWRSRSVKGKSLLFMVLIEVGYCFGMAAKILSGHVTYVLIFYGINFLLVLTDILLYFRNAALEKKAEN